MNIKQIRKEVKVIREYSGDPEMAHCFEDELMNNFIKHVEKAGSPELQEMASEVLKTADIEFPRWYA